MGFNLGDIGPLIGDRGQELKDMKRAHAEHQKIQRAIKKAQRGGKGKGKKR